MNIIIFEDLNTINLEPFSINHASFELKCGIYSNLNRNFGQYVRLHDQKICQILALF